MDSGRLFFDPSRYGNMFFRNCDPIFRGPRSVMGLQEPLKRRTFFTSPDEVFDEEYYDEQLPEKKRRLTPEQVHLLEQSFEEENKLEPERKTQLAKKVGLQPRQVAVWFQNHRARWKTKHLEREFDCLKSSYESLLSECDSIHKENEKLKAEVVSLTEKVQAKEVAGAKSDPVPEDAPILSPLQLNVKAEDRLCSGSGGSAVVDEDGPQLMDSGDSYFLNDNYPGCMGPVDSLQSEEDDGSGDGRSFFSCALAAAEQQLHEEGEPLGWWVWSLNN